ncbi:MAG: ParB/RepB/Spo0J family partition protein [Clostridia bacterium]|nr:ParB/RepB/Spo0J family partition protein [Clostridia bacterium]
MAKKDLKMKLPTVDDLFSTEEQRQEDKKTKIEDIPISEIDAFPDHPFKVRDDEDMRELVDSIREHGVITPATVRKKEDGRYEIISGHRRKHACELLGIDTLRCEVVDLTNEEATVIMVESNFQRSTILPSEKAFAYKMRLDAMKKQGVRTDLTSAPAGHKLSREELAEQTGDSHSQIQRYIRLTNLVPELLEFVDEGRMKMRPAVELSYLDEEAQRNVVDCIDSYDATPSHDQAIRIRKSFAEGSLDYPAIDEIMGEEKPNQQPALKISSAKLKGRIPPNFSVAQAEEFVLKALDYYNKYLKIQRDNGAR